MRFLIPLVLTICGLAHGDRVQWTGTGTVTSVTGAFDEGGIAADDQVSMTFSYDDDAEFDQRKDIPPPFSERERDYYSDVNLSMTVTVGDHTWEGSVVSGVLGLPLTLFVRTGNFSEKFEPLLREEEMAEFTSFPFDAEMGDNTIGMKFDGNAPVFLQSGIEVDSINPLEITNATGSITTGGNGNTLAFSLEIGSIRVSPPDEGPVDDEPLVLSIETGETTVSLSWETEVGVSYQLQEAAGLEEDDWTTVEATAGTGETVTSSRLRSAETRFYRLIRE